MSEQDMTTPVGTNTALLVIDVQNAVVDSPIHDRERVLTRIAGLIAEARREGVPVIYVQHEVPDWELMAPGSFGWQIHAAVAPREGEITVRKRAGDAFYETDLKEQLDRLGIDHLIVCGCETNACVNATVFRALTLDYDITVASDAHSTGYGTWDDPLMSGAQIIAYYNEHFSYLQYPRHKVVVKPSAEIWHGAAAIAAR